MNARFLFLSVAVGLLLLQGPAALTAVAETTNGPDAALQRRRALENELTEAIARAAQRNDQAGTIAVQQTPDRILFASPRVALVADPRGSYWHVLWAGDVRVELSDARISVAASGNEIPLAQPQSSVRPFRDTMGTGQELRQEWKAQGLRVERELRAYDRLGIVTVGGRIVNESTQEIALGTTKVLELATNGWWRLGDASEAPAALFIQSRSLLRTRPFESSPPASPAERRYRSSGVLALVSRHPAAALVIGCLRADEAVPDLEAGFRLQEGGASLSASCRFLDRNIRPGESLELNRLYLGAESDACGAMERYGDAVVACSTHPARTRPTGLWCSWYAHRMGMTEDKVLANAEVAARHFKQLGLEIMQLDHGWQRGDVTGDWTPNERFPHGLRWLADELRQRYGLRLGVWIAPTDVAETSELFQRHPDWMLKGDDGKPRVNWRWYWKPNPNCYELDASQPDAERYIADCFRQLTSQGVSYYKIDFIASAGGEHFVQRDPHSTRGWSVLRRAMEAIRQGAGDDAWIRYCQTPPLLSVWLADSTVGGGDTLDAGPGSFRCLLENAEALAAGWWLNDRLYHREVCDMSVRMQGGIEEVRTRAALMTLANCSISWSDELCFLPPSRIRLMQQCMPPGNPPMRPLDLFERDIPSVWHIRATNNCEAWDVVGLFNLTGQPQSRAVSFEQLGLKTNAEQFVFEFWEEKFLGRLKGGLELVLPPESSRILSIRHVTDHPQLIGTDLHLLQGVHEIQSLNWDAKTATLSGVYRRVPGIAGKAFFYLPDGWFPKFEFPLSPASAQLTHVEGPIWMQELAFTSEKLAWSLPFEPPKPPPAKEPTGN